MVEDNDEQHEACIYEGTRRHKVIKTDLWHYYRV